MSELLTRATQLENLANAVFRLERDGNLSPEDLASIQDSLKRSIKMLEVVTGNFEKGIKNGLELNETINLGGFSYYYKVSESTVFDADKAKNTLKDLDYSLEDFTKVQVRKSLKADKII